MLIFIALDESSFLQGEKEHMLEVPQIIRDCRL